MQKLDVAVLGATGAVGQRFIQLLEGHPWFRVAEVIGSERSAGKPYGEIARWVLDGSAPESVVNMTVKPLDSALSSPLVFSALPKEAADPIEMQLAAAGHIVCTNAATNRMIDDVPLLLPEANADHLKLIDVQRANRGWTTGALVANSNCTAMPVVMALAPLRKYGVRKLHMVSAQATSGAGYPGVASLDILDNVVPYVGGDEQKLETETLRMLGSFNGETVDWMETVASATCTRVATVDGHLVMISVGFDAAPSLENIINDWNNEPGMTHLPSAPEKPLMYLPQIDRPQVRRDRNAGRGMTTSLGRLRECPLLGYKFVALSHNTIRGAAGGSILNAELMAVEGYIADFQPAALNAVP